MAKIVDRGRKYVGAFHDPEGEIGSILTWRIWYVMDSGQRYSMSIDIAVPQASGLTSSWTDDDLKAFGDRFNAENQEQLDRAQTNFENMGPTWKLPQEGPSSGDSATPPASAGPDVPTNDPAREHHPGECWCGTTHPDHMMNWTLGPCWCGKTGVHNVGMGRP